MDCVFCSIVKKETPAKIIYEDKKILGFESIKPEAPIHYLFIPKKHLEWKDSFSKEKKALIGGLLFVAKKTAQKTEIFEACKFIFNIGKTGHIAHIHLHLLGGWKRKVPQRNI